VCTITPHMGLTTWDDTLLLVLDLLPPLVADLLLILPTCWLQ